MLRPAPFFGDRPSVKSLMPYTHVSPLSSFSGRRSRSTRSPPLIVSNLLMVLHFGSFPRIGLSPSATRLCRIFLFFSLFLSLFLPLQRPPFSVFSDYSRAFRWRNRLLGLLRGRLFPPSLHSSFVRWPCFTPAQVVLRGMFGRIPFDVFVLSVGL